MFAPVTNSRLQWRTSAVASTSGPTIIPGVSTRVTIGSPKASHSCMNRAALSAPSESIAPARWVGLLAITPTGRPSMRASAVIMPSPNPLRNSSTEPTSNSASTARCMSYARSRSTGTAAARRLRVGRRPVRHVALEVRHVPLRHRHRFRLVGDDDVDDPVRALHVDRADRGGFVDAEPAALDHRRSTHADVRVLGGDDHVATAQDGGVAGEAVPGVHARRAAPCRTTRRTSGTPGSRARSPPAHRCHRAGRRRLR